MRKKLREAYEQFLFTTMVRCAGLIGYNACVFLPPHTEEVRVVHFYATEWDLRNSMRVYLEELDNHCQKH